MTRIVECPIQPGSAQGISDWSLTDVAGIGGIADFGRKFLGFVENLLALLLSNLSNSSKEVIATVGVLRLESLTQFTTPQPWWTTASRHRARDKRVQPTAGTQYKVTFALQCCARGYRQGGKEGS
jgi:hypothetical protein